MRRADCRGPASRTDYASYRDNIFRVGVNYHFNQAEVAKY
jgi:hypothetical protein